MLGSPAAQHGGVLAARGASGSGRKRQGEGDSAAHTEVGAGGAEGEEEEAGGGGGRSGPLAGSCCSQSGRLLTAGDLRGTNKAAGASGGPLPPWRPRHAGPGPAPPGPGGRRRRARSGEDRAGSRHLAGSGFETAWGPGWPRLDPPPPNPLLPIKIGEGRRRSGGATGPAWQDGRWVNYEKGEGAKAGPGLSEVHLLQPPPVSQPGDSLSGEKPWNLQVLMTRLSPFQTPVASLIWWGWCPPSLSSCLCFIRLY